MQKDPNISITLNEEFNSGLMVRAKSKGCCQTKPNTSQSTTVTQIYEEDEDFYLPLHYAIEFSQNDAVLRQLIYLGADPFQYVKWADRSIPIFLAMAFTKNHEMIFEMISSKKKIRDPQTWLFNDRDLNTIADEATARHDAILFLQFFKDIGLLLKRENPIKQSITWVELGGCLKDLEPKTALENNRSLVGVAIAQGNIESVEYLYSLGHSMYDFDDQRKIINELAISYGHVALNLGEGTVEKYIKMKREKIKFVSEAHPSLFFDSPSEFLFFYDDDLEKRFFDERSFANFLSKRYFFNKPRQPKELSLDEKFNKSFSKSEVRSNEKFKKLRDALALQEKCKLKLQILNRSLDPLALKFEEDGDQTFTGTDQEWETYCKLDDDKQKISKDLWRADWKVNKEKEKLLGVPLF
jgi:hypothetical protein